MGHNLAGEMTKVWDVCFLNTKKEQTFSIAAPPYMRDLPRAAFKVPFVCAKWMMNYHF